MHVLFTLPSEYELTAYISHMGEVTMCGHYVCHIKKDGKWIIFKKVGVSVTRE